MFKRILKVFGGDPTERDIQTYGEIADQIMALEAQYAALSDAELQSKTAELRAKVAEARSGLTDEDAIKKAEAQALNDIMVDAFATVREASVRTIGLRHYDVQLIGGQVLHAGRIAEMRTGEGKTLVATLPLYLNAMTGRSVHLVTVNDYLARRDAKWMAPIFAYLGLSVGILQNSAVTDHARMAFIYDPDVVSDREEKHNMRYVPRPETYACDLVYGTTSEFGFDYLRDNMARRWEDRRQGELNMAIIDEVDNVLIDESRTPLIISGPSHEDSALYKQLAQVTRKLTTDHYEIDERSRSIQMTDEGFDRVEELLGTPLRDPENPEVVTNEQARIYGHLEQAMRAEYIFLRNKDYLVQNKEVVIVDQSTGRMMPGRRWSDGLHQAVEAKEGLRVQSESVTYATVTIQNFFRMYNKLAGMSGTAVTESEEFDEIYSMDVVPVPTRLDYRAQKDPELEVVTFKEDGHKFEYVARKDSPDIPVLHRRKDYDDLVFRTEEAKYRALIEDALNRHCKGQPLLLGTTSVESSEMLGHRLSAMGVRRLCQTLLLRDTWFEVNNREEDGRVVPELSFLNAPLQSLSDADLRPMARELGISLNPTQDENLDRLLRALELEPQYRDKLKEVLDLGIKHEVLNAKNHERESKIIAHAGEPYSVTIATNMAGRGVDIKLGGEIEEETINRVNRALVKAEVRDPYSLNNEQRIEALQDLPADVREEFAEEIETFQHHIQGAKIVRAAGGLHVLGSERHEARRIDNQLRGRASRQGDPGSSSFYLSLEDDLMRRFGGENVSGLMARLRIDEALPIEHGIVNRSVEQSQTRVEGSNFDVRKHLLEYDDVINAQRKQFYEQRNRIFLKEDLNEDLGDMIDFEVGRRIENSQDDEDGWWRLLDWLDKTHSRPQARADGTFRYPFSIELLLRKIANDVPSLAHAWEKQRDWHVANYESVINGESSDLRSEADTKKDIALKALDTAYTDLPAIRESILDIARASSLAYRQRIITANARALENLPDRAEERIRTKQGQADLAFEIYEMESREMQQPMDVKSAMKVLREATSISSDIPKEQQAGLHVDNLLKAFRGHIDNVTRTAMVKRQISAIESRYNLKLNMGTVPDWNEIDDWPSYSDQIVDAMEAAHVARTERDLKDIESTLNAGLREPTRLTRESLANLIRVDIAHSRATRFENHQKKQVLVRRFPYIYHAAELLGDPDADSLRALIVEHLTEVQELQQQELGELEMKRLGKVMVTELAEKDKTAMKEGLGEDLFMEIEKFPFGALRGKRRQAVREFFGHYLMLRNHRNIMIAVNDQLWVEHLTSVEALRTSAGLESFAQRDPLTAYKRRAFESFQELNVNLRSNVVTRLFKWDPDRAPKIATSVDAVVDATPTAKAAESNGAAQAATESDDSKNAVKSNKGQPKPKQRGARNNSKKKKKQPKRPKRLRK